VEARDLQLEPAKSVALLDRRLHLAAQRSGIQVQRANWRE
jgi:hypothetical protein